MDAQEWLVVNALPGMGALRIAQLVARQPQWPEGWLAALPSRAASELRLCPAGRLRQAWEGRATPVYRVASLRGSTGYAGRVPQNCPNYLPPLGHLGQVGQVGHLGQSILGTWLMCCFVLRFCVTLCPMCVSCVPRYTYMCSVSMGIKVGRTR